LAVPIGIEGRR